MHLITDCEGIWITSTSQQTARIHSKEDTGKELPTFGPRLAQSINQEEMSDKSSEGPKRFDRVDNLCFKIKW